MNPAFASRDPARATPSPPGAPGAARAGEALLVRAHRLLFQHLRTFVGLLALPHAVAFLLVLAALRGGPRVLVLPLLLAWGAVYLAAWTALIWAVAEALERRPVGIARALRQVTPGVLGRLLLTHLLAAGVLSLLALALGVLVALLLPLGGIAAPLGALALTVGALLIVRDWLLPVLFLPQVVILEGLGGPGALSRCRQLVAGRRWRILGLWALFTLLEGLVSWVFSRWPPLQALAQLLVAPLGAIWVTLLYTEGSRPMPRQTGPIVGRGSGAGMSPWN